MPSIAEASLFSSLFVGNQALADSSSSTTPTLDNSQNLQSIPLLAADVSSGTSSSLNASHTPYIPFKVPLAKKDHYLRRCPLEKPSAKTN